MICVLDFAVLTTIPESFQPKPGGYHIRGAQVRGEIAVLFSGPTEETGFESSAD